MQKIAPFLILLFIFTSCYKNTDNTTEEIIIRPPTVILNAELTGSYSLDASTEKNELIIKINDEFHLAAHNLLPRIELNQAIKKGQFIELFSDNTLVGAAQLALVENEINYTKLLTIEPFQNKVLNGDFSLSLGDMSTISFQGVTFETLVNEPYSGTIHVNYSESVDAQYNQQLSTFSFDEVGRMVVIQPELSFYFQPLTQDDQRLKINEGFIDLRLDGIEDANLYHLNEENQSWEWISKIVDGQPTQEIKVSGWFLVGLGLPSVLIEGNVLKDELPISFMQLDFASEGFKTATYSTAGGKFIAFNSRNSELQIDAQNNCGSTVFSRIETMPNVDEFSLELSLEAEDGQFLKNDFLMVNCSVEEMAQSNFRITYTTGTSEIVSKVGTSQSWIPVCDGTFEISGYAAERDEFGPVLAWDLQDPFIGVLSNCASHLDGFSWIKIRDDVKVFQAFNSDLSMDRLTLEAENQVFRLIVEADSKGTFPEDKVNIKIDDSDFGSNGYFVSCEKAEAGCGIQELKITHLRPEGDEWNRIYFSGTIWMQTKSPPQSGNFEIEGYILSKK